MKMVGWLRVRNSVRAVAVVISVFIRIEGSLTLRIFQTIKPPVSGERLISWGDLADA